MFRLLIPLVAAAFLGFSTSAEAQCRHRQQAVFSQQIPLQFQVPLQVDVIPQVSVGFSGAGVGFSNGFAGGSVAFPGGFVSGSVGGFGGFSSGGFVPASPQIINTGIGGRRDVILGQLGGRVLIQRSGILGRRRLILE